MDAKDRTVVFTLNKMSVEMPYKCNHNIGTNCKDYSGEYILLKDAQQENAELKEKNIEISKALKELTLLGVDQQEENERLRGFAKAAIKMWYSEEDSVPELEAYGKLVEEIENELK